MRALHELQQRFAGVVTGAGNASSVLAMIVEDAPGARARLAIYANHYRVTLIEALATTFPVTRRLVGCDFFGLAARRYVREVPPCQPVMSEYGDSFPAFLEMLPEAAGVPFLADVARLEWALNLAAQAPDPEPPAGVGGFRLHPSCRMVCSPFAIDDIWQAHQPTHGDLAAVDLDAGPVRLLIGRKPDDTVGWIRLPDADAAFAGSLIAGGDLPGALAAAHKIDASFEPVPFIAALIECGFAVLPDQDREEELSS